MSDCLQPHESQHARPLCPSPTPGVHSDTSIESVMPSSHLILCRPFLLLPPIPPSIRVFSNKSALHMRWPKYWSFSLSISPSNEHPALVSFRKSWISFQSKGLARVFSKLFRGAHWIYWLVLHWKEVQKIGKLSGINILAIWGLLLLIFYLDSQIITRDSDLTYYTSDL